MKIKRTILITAILLIVTLVPIITISNFIKKDREVFTDKNSVTVYFVRTFDNDLKLLSVRRKIYEKEDRLKVALGELLRGPENNEKKLGYSTEIPVKTELIELKETPERIIINLSREFEKGGGSASMTLRLQQLVNTALDSADKKPVYLELEGEQVKHIGGEGVMIPQPLSGNLSRGQNI